MKVGVLAANRNSGEWDGALAADGSRGPAVPDRDVVDNTLLLMARIEPLGFDSIWTTEHYGSPFSMNSNPLQWLAYWAARTERVDMGTAVLVLPWWDPIRLATEMAMLDLLLDGRRFLPGVGRGVAASEFASLRIPPEESRERFSEVLDIIRLADTQEEFSYDGRYYTIPRTSVRPQPPHKGHLLDDVRGVSTSKASIDLATRKGLGQILIGGTPLDELGRRCVTFNETRMAEGLEPDQPNVMLSSHCVATEDEANDAVRRVHHLLRQARDHYRMWRGPASGPDVAHEQAVEQPVLQLIGTPDQIIEKARALQDAVGNTSLILHIDAGGMSHKEAMASLELFAAEVLPVVQAMEPLKPVSRMLRLVDDHLSS